MPWRHFYRWWSQIPFYKWKNCNSKKTDWTTSPRLYNYRPEPAFSKSFYWHLPISIHPFLKTCKGCRGEKGELKFPWFLVPLPPLPLIFPPIHSQICGKKLNTLNWLHLHSPPHLVLNPRKHTLPHQPKHSTRECMSVILSFSCILNALYRAGYVKDRKVIWNL